MTPTSAVATARTEETDRASLEIIRRRGDFLRAARAKRSNAQAFGLQARRRDDDDPVIRVGYTCSRKVGNAVARNRAKRRLRAIAREVLPSHGEAGWDYVLIGRPVTTAQRPHKDLLADLQRAIEKIHKSER